MNPFLAVLTASCLARLSYQMARSPVLPRFAESLGAAPELIGIIVAASTVTGVLFKLPAGALSDLLGRRRVMLLGAVFLPFRPSFIHSSQTPALCSRCALFMVLRQRSLRRSHRPMWPALPRRGEAPGLAGSRRPTTSVQRRGH